MADSTEAPAKVQYIDVLTSALIALIAGLVIHSFIIAVNVNDWLKGRSVTPVDQVISSLGIARICAQCTLTICLFVGRLLLKKRFSYVNVVIIGSVYFFFTYSNIWLTSLLSIVFCLKISTLRTRLFLYLRRMIDRRTARCIVGSVLLSGFNSLLPFVPAIIEVIEESTSNTTMEDLFIECNFINLIYSHIIGSLIPLLFYCISSILLFSSLYHHITKMKMSGNLSINLETYYSAMRFVAITFIYNIIYFAGYFVDIFHYYSYCVSLPWLLIFFGFLPVLHSSYLIYRTAKLRSQMSKVLHNVTGFLFQRKDLDTREEIEVTAQ